MSGKVDIQKAIELAAKEVAEYEDSLKVNTELGCVEQWKENYAFEMGNSLLFARSLLSLAEENERLTKENTDFKKLSSRLIDNAVMSEQGDVFGYRDRAEELFKENSTLKAEVERLKEELEDDLEYIAGGKELFAENAMLKEKLGKDDRFIKHIQ